MRSIGLDVHRDFCEVAIIENGRCRSAPRVVSGAEAIESFARSLGPDDEVALENTGNARAIAQIIAPHVARVAVANPLAVRAISHAKVKTDRIDAATLAKLLAAGFLPEVFFGDENTRVLRRRISRRAQLVKQRTAAKNETHAVLQRNLKGKPPVTDLFGVSGRTWLAAQVLPPDEGETVEGCLRQIELLDGEVAAMDRAIAEHALTSQPIRRLMTIPGVAVTSAAAIVAAIGDVQRFASPRHLVSYLGLNPTVHQSGEAPPRMGRISKAGSTTARHVLVEAAWTAVQSPGPLRAFGQRIAARRGHNVAAVAVARKIAVLSWHLLTRETDYAFARPTLVRQKIRRLERAAGAPSKQGQRGATGTWASPQTQAAERAVAQQAETAYRRLVADWISTKKQGAGAANGARMFKRSERKAARQGSAPNPALRSGVTRTPANPPAEGR